MPRVLPNKLRSASKARDRARARTAATGEIDSPVQHYGNATLVHARESIRIRDLQAGRKPGACGERERYNDGSVTESPSAIKRASRLIRWRCAMRPRDGMYSRSDESPVKDTQAADQLA